MVAFLFDSFPLHPWTVGTVKLVPAYNQVAHLARRATGASDTLAVCGVDFAWAAIKAQRWERREYFKGSA